MKKSSTSSSRANGLAAQVEVRYTRCPMCGSDRIKMGAETLRLKKGARDIDVRVRRWACAKCGEKFLTAESREKIDAAIVSKPSRRRVA